MNNYSLLIPLYGVTCYLLGILVGYWWCRA